MADGAGPVPGTSARRLVPGSASLTKAQVGGTVVCVKTRRSEAARRRWEGSTGANGDRADAAGRTAAAAHGHGAARCGGGGRAACRADGRSRGHAMSMISVRGVEVPAPPAVPYRYGLFSIAPATMLADPHWLLGVEFERHCGGHGVQREPLAFCPDPPPPAATPDRWCEWQHVRRSTCSRCPTVRSSTPSPTSTWNVRPVIGCSPASSPPWRPSCEQSWPRRCRSRRPPWVRIPLLPPAQGRPGLRQGEPRPDPGPRPSSDSTEFERDLQAAFGKVPGSDAPAV